MKSNRPIALVIFLLTTACLVITTLMTRQSGVASATSAEGQQYLGWASIAIHLGLPAFGIATGAMMRAGNKGFAGVCMVLVVLCALFSVRNVMSFVAAERISITKAREAEEQRKTAREQAALKAAADRQKTLNDMAKQQLGWIQGTAEDQRGRLARKDMVEAGTKFIREFSETEVKVAPGNAPSKEIAIRTDAGAEMLAEFTGWKVSVWQFTDVVQIVAMLIIFETFGWPVGSYLWASGRIPISVGTLEVVTPSPVAARAQRLLSPPKKDKPVTIRTEPSAEWRALLDQIDFPAAGVRYKGPERPRLEPGPQALRFLAWLGAYNECGRYHGTQVDDLYSEFLNADHRKETAVRQVKSEMERFNRGKFASKKAVPGEGTVWNLAPPTLDRMTLLLQRAELLPPDTPSNTPGDTPSEEPEGGAAPAKRASSIIALSPSFWGRRQGGLPN